MTFLEVRIKPLQEEQLPAVVALDKLCLGGLWTMAGYQRELASPNSQILVLTTPAPGKKNAQLAQESIFLLGIGCFWMILDEAHLTVLAVHPDYQGQGLGQLLLYHLLREAVDHGLERSTLEVRESNQVALAIYHKFGFREAGRRKAYYPNNLEDALILWRSGLQTPEFQLQLATWQQRLQQRLGQLPKISTP